MNQPSTDLIFTITFSTIAILLSVIALIVTVKTYLLKSGALIRGWYLIQFSIECKDRFVCEVALENLKDRAVVIFKIFLLLGYNYYLEIEDCENEPIILKPFEVFKKIYEPIDFYSLGTDQVDLNGLLENYKLKKKLVLLTTDGKYTVKTHIKHWDPVIEFFNNHSTAIIHPMRSHFKNKSYGSNVKYIVVLKTESGNEETIPIYNEENNIRVFKKFKIDKDALQSKDSLENFLIEKADMGFLNGVDLKIYDLDAWRNEVYNLEKKDVYVAEPYGWFQYYIFGRLRTKISDYRLKKKNKKNRKRLQFNK